MDDNLLSSKVTFVFAADGSTALTAAAAPISNVSVSQAESLVFNLVFNRGSGFGNFQPRKKRENWIA